MMTAPDDRNEKASPPQEGFSGRSSFGVTNELVVRETRLRHQHAFIVPHPVKPFARVLMKPKLRR